MMTTNINKWHLAALLALLLTALPAQAELVVIVNSDVKVDKLTRNDVINIFMGRYRKFPDGSTVQPLDIKGESIERQDFYKKLLDKNLADINAYWARLIFSGRIAPPLKLGTQYDILERVTNDPAAIGYMERSGLNAKVKVVYSLP